MRFPPPEMNVARSESGISIEGSRSDHVVISAATIASKASDVRCATSVSCQGAAVMSVVAVEQGFRVVCILGPRPGVVE